MGRDLIGCSMIGARDSGSRCGRQALDRKEESMRLISIGGLVCAQGLVLALLLGAGCGKEGDEVTGQRSDSIGDRGGDAVLLEFGNVADKPPAEANKPPA